MSETDQVQGDQIDRWGRLQAENARLAGELARVKSATKEAVGHLYRHIMLDDNDEIDTAIEILEQAVIGGGEDE